MSVPLFHRLDVRDKLGLLHRLMRVFAGGKISFEGDLSKCAFSDDMVVAREEVGILRRNTLYPRQDFVVLRLDSCTLAPIFKEITSAGLSRAIIHVEIEHGGVLQLCAHDNFHPECVISGPGVSTELLAELEMKHLLRSYSVVEVINSNESSSSNRDSNRNYFG